VPCRYGFRMCLFHLIHTVRPCLIHTVQSCLIHTCLTAPVPCHDQAVLKATSQGHDTERHGHGMVGRSGDRIPVGARFSEPVQTGPGAHPASCTMGTESFLGVQSGRGVTLTPHLLQVPRSKNRVELYLYSP
jgi:hypothetical protein